MPLYTLTMSGKASRLSSNVQSYLTLSLLRSKCVFLITVVLLKKSVFQEHTNKEIKAPSLFDEDSWMSSGRGLMLISNLVDSFQVLRCGRKNTFVLIKREGRLTTKQSSVTLPGS